MYYGLNGTITTHKGQGQELLQILLQAAEMLQDNPDCIHYVVSRIEGEPDAIWVSEVWTDEEAQAASLEPGEIRALISQARPLIADMGQQIKLNVLGGKGL